MPRTGNKPPGNEGKIDESLLGLLALGGLGWGGGHSLLNIQDAGNELPHDVDLSLGVPAWNKGARELAGLLPTLGAKTNTRRGWGTRRLVEMIGSLDRAVGHPREG